MSNLNLHNQVSFGSKNFNDKFMEDRDKASEEDNLKLKTEQSDKADSLNMFNQGRDPNMPSHSWSANDQAKKQMEEGQAEHSMYSLSQAQGIVKRNTQYVEHRSLPKFKNSEIFVNKDSRLQLPFFRDPNEKVPMWDILKKSMGQDLSKVSMPVILAEPLTALQRTCEMLMQ